MQFAPRILSLITTHKCTAACEHCCFSCTPKVTDAIPIPRLYNLIDEAKNIKSLKVIVFTGGECFLLGKDLIRLIKKAHDYGFFTRCVTNGYWGKSRSLAKKKALELRLNGLTEINFSTGTFHGEYVNPESVINAAIECSKSGIRTLINVETYKGDDFDIQAFTENKEIIELINRGFLKVQRNVWMKNGGEIDFEYLEEHSRFEEKNQMGCSTVLNALTVNPKQDLIACCGLHLEKIPELKLGSIKNQRLDKVYNDISVDLIKMWVHVEGPEKILNFVKKMDPSYELPTHYVHQCETCLHLYKDKKAQEVILANYNLIKTKILNQYYDSIAYNHISNDQKHPKTSQTIGIQHLT